MQSQPAEVPAVAQAQGNGMAGDAPQWRGL